MDWLLVFPAVQHFNTYIVLGVVARAVHLVWEKKKDKYPNPSNEYQSYLAEFFIVCMT